jgi:phage-related minor tail protein
VIHVTVSHATVSHSTDGNGIFRVAIIAAVVSSVIIIVSCLGCCGAWKVNPQKTFKKF